MPKPNGRVVKNGAIALARTYSKFGKPLPPWRRLCRTPGSGSAIATPDEYDSVCLVPVKVGTPPVTLNVNLDTASADFWVYSDDLPQWHQGGHKIYKPSESSTSKRLSGSTFAIKCT